MISEKKAPRRDRGRCKAGWGGRVQDRWKQVAEGKGATVEEGECTGERNECTCVISDVCACVPHTHACVLARGAPVHPGPLLGVGVGVWPLAVAAGAERAAGAEGVQ